MSHGGMTEDMAREYGHRLATALYYVEAEMHRQIAKWGEQNHPSYLNVDIFGMEDAFPATDLTKYAKMLCDKRLGMGICSWQDIFNEEVLEARDEAIAGNYEALKVELIQVAAVAMSWYLSVERNGR